MGIVRAASHDSRPPVYLVSACLVGLKTRYDGTARINESCLRQLTGCPWVPVCPEQLGGLATPRPAADLVGGDGRDVLAGRARVVTKEGVDVTQQFILGAHQVLLIAESEPVIAGAILKAGSPSCGLSPVLGVTTALLKSRGIPVFEL